MPANRSREFTESSGGSRARPAGGRFRPETARSGGRGDDGPGGGGRKGSDIGADYAQQDEFLNENKVSPLPHNRGEGNKPMGRATSSGRSDISSRLEAAPTIVGGMKKSYMSGDTTPRQKRLLREALGFLESTLPGYGSGLPAPARDFAGTSRRDERQGSGQVGGDASPERTLKSLFALYEGIDPFADYIKPGEREFFPVLRAERTLERYLEGFKYIYYILRRAEERVRLAGVFDNFWARCTAYLARCGYSEKYISDICKRDGIFYRQSFAWWRREYGDQEEGFSPMYEYFRACFGVEGNDDYCAAGGKDGVSYDWRRMKACHEKETASRARVETVYVKPVWEEWSEENRKRVRELIESLRREGGEEESAGPPEADMILAEIRRRNRDRGIFV